MSNPWTISGERVQLSSPEYDWEKHGTPLINEGPKVLRHGAKSSGAGWNRRVNMQRFTWNADGSPDFGTPVAAGVPLAVPADSPAK